jgi:flagellar export protein FliJ
VKRYRFRLEQVLRVRRIQEEQARLRVHAAQREVVTADAHVASRLASYAATAATTVRGDRSALMSARASAELSARAVEHARTAAGQARAVHADRLDQWSGAAQRVEALERLEERRRAEYAVEEQRDIDRSVDDLVSGRRPEEEGR